MTRSKLPHCGLIYYFFAQTCLFAFQANPNGSLVQVYKNQKYINPFFSSQLLEEMHELIKRSYTLSNRGSNHYDYLQKDALRQHRLYRFDKHNVWFCHRPFIGTHGTDGLGGVFYYFSYCFPWGQMKEVDYAGFVALKAGTKTRPPVMAIVFRGSQSKSFQSLKGYGGASWLTNWDASKMSVPPKLGFTGEFHKGFLNKYLSLRESLFGDIFECYKKVPIEARKALKIVITGHSQGAGVALIAASDIAKYFGKEFFGTGFDNKKTPHFFVYALSGPNSIGNRTTKDLFYKIIGKDNTIRHSSVFDIVTYSCLGQKFQKKWLFNLFAQSLFGVETGYLPVGHLAIDDIKDLLKKGFDYNNQAEYKKNLGQIVEYFVQGYQYYLRTYVSESFITYRLYKFLAVLYYQYGFNLMGGIGNFVAIQHYGSLGCLLSSKLPKKSYGFDPRMPESRLEDALYRGEKHRLATKKELSYLEAPRILCRQLILPKLKGLEQSEQSSLIGNLESTQEIKVPSAESLRLLAETRN